MTASCPVDHAIVTIRGKLGFMRLIRTRSVPDPHHSWIAVVHARPRDCASKNISHEGRGARICNSKIGPEETGLHRLPPRVLSLSRFEPELSTKKSKSQHVVGTSLAFIVWKLRKQVTLKQEKEKSSKEAGCNLRTRTMSFQGAATHISHMACFA